MSLPSTNADSGVQEAVMNRWLITLGACAVLGGVLSHTAGRAQQPGTPGLNNPFAPNPAGQGAVLKQPWLENTPPPSGSYIQGVFQQSPNGQGFPANPANQMHPALAALLPSQAVEINRDIEVTPALGPWVICMTTFLSDDAPMKARELATILRRDYKLHAYVFTHGVEEKRKEFERLKAQIEKQREALKDFGPDVDWRGSRIKKMAIKEQCGVMLCGYRDQDAAAQALKQIRSLDPKLIAKLNPGLLDVKMHAMLKVDDKNQAPTLDKIEMKQGSAEAIYINPFQRAFIGPNPTIKRETPKEGPQYDMADLKKLNADETFSLLKNPKRFTLAIKQYETPTSYEGRDAPAAASIFTKFNVLKKTNQIDYAAENAHGLAEVLRKNKLEAYVLHTKYASVVTVGAYDNLEDPQLRSMQDFLKNRPQLQVVQIFPTPMPMQVPR
jgi:hypothetical protein